jgi:hypothetical protein
MKILETKSLTFVVRVWLEQPAGRGTPALWRGSVANVIDREKRYFEDLSDVLTFIDPYIKQLVENKTQS